jgi:hypothetical protein
MLRDKKKSDDQRGQAMYAITLYFEMIRHKQYTKASAMTHYQLTGDKTPQTCMSAGLQQPVNIVKKSYYNEDGYKVKTDSPEWDEVLAKLAAEIKVRHYSRKTLQTYAIWSRKFQSFLKTSLLRIFQQLTSKHT